MEKIIKFFTGDREPAYSYKLSNQLSLTCRVIVGGYVLHIAYSLKDSVKDASSGESIVFIIAMIFFSIAGAGLVYTSLRDFIIGRYKGGKLDLGDDPDDFSDVFKDK